MIGLNSHQLRKIASRLEHLDGKVHAAALALPESEEAQVWANYDEAGDLVIFVAETVEETETR